MATPVTIFVTTASGDSAAPSSDGLAVSAATTHYSKTWGAADSDGQGLQLRWTGTPTGTFTLWMSDKPHPSEADDTDWVQDTTWAPTNPAGSASKFRTDTGNAKAYRKRVKYVHGSGSGTVYGYVTVPRSF